MQSGRVGLCLRIFIHEASQTGHRPLYAAIVELARREGLAGATVLSGIEGYGRRRRMHTSRLVDLADDLPIIVEIVDTPEAIEGFLPRLDALTPHVTAVLSQVEIVKHSASSTR